MEPTEPGTAQKRRRVGPDGEYSAGGSSSSSISSSGEAKVASLDADLRGQSREIPVNCDLITQMGALVDNEKFADIHFLVGMGPTKRCVPAHKSILAARTPVFEALLYGGMYEAQSGDDVIVEDIAVEPFLATLRFIYTDSLTGVTVETVFGTLYAAKKYQLDKLERACIEFVEQQLTLSNAFEFMRGAENLKESQLADRCLQHILLHASEFTRSSSWLELDLPAVKAILERSELAMFELDVARALWQWAGAEVKREDPSAPDTPERRRKSIEPLMPLVRFPLISPKDLAGEVRAMGILKDSEIATVLLHLASEGKAECPFEAAPRRLRSIKLQYRHDFDTNGLVYFVGTQGRSMLDVGSSLTDHAISPFANRPGVEFKNPHTERWLNVNASAVQHGQLAQLTSRKHGDFWTHNLLHSWVSLDLGEGVVLKPNYYTLMHGWTGDDFNRNFVLEASNDFKRWDVLMNHVNDMSLNESYDTHSWPIPGVTNFYRCFRVRVTGLCDPPTSYYLVIGGLELYGELVLLRDPVWLHPSAGGTAAIKQPADQQQQIQPQQEQQQQQQQQQQQPPGQQPDMEHHQHPHHHHHHHHLHEMDYQLMVAMGWDPAGDHEEEEEEEQEEEEEEVEEEEPEPEVEEEPEEEEEVEMDEEEAEFLQHPFSIPVGEHEEEEEPEGGHQVVL